MVTHRTKRFFSRRFFGSKTPMISVGTKDVLTADWANHPYKKPAPINKDTYSIGWVIPPIGESSGGHQNILRFVRYLEAQGHECSVYISDPEDIQTQYEIDRVMKRYPDMKAEAVRGLEGIENCDAIFATSWQTAYPVFNIKTSAHKFYFVQDYEPYFYPVGTESVLAENTYRFGFHGITAGGWLSKKLKSEFNMPCDYYEFGSDSDRYNYVNSGERKKIMFYARPVTPRRGFEMGVLALELFNKKHPEYEINLVGWNVSEQQLPFTFVNHGSLRLDQLNDLYNDAAAALVLSFTNMSLLPLELLSAGCIPVVNDADNNRLVSNNPFIAYTMPTPSTLAEALSEIVTKKDLPAYAKEASASVEQLNWDTAGARLEKALVEELRG